MFKTLHSVHDKSSYIFVCIFCIQDFEFCLNKTGPIPADLRNTPLGSIPKPCVDWKIHRPCYKNLADDYDECLVNRPGLVKKGTDALRFTHAYAKFICGNIADTEGTLIHT